MNELSKDMFFASGGKDEGRDKLTMSQLDIQLEFLAAQESKVESDFEHTSTWESFDTLLACNNTLYQDLYSASLSSDDLLLGTTDLGSLYPFPLTLDTPSMFSTLDDKPGHSIDHTPSPSLSFDSLHSPQSTLIDHIPLPQSEPVPSINLTTTVHPNDLCNQPAEDHVPSILNPTQRSTTPFDDTVTQTEDCKIATLHLEEPGLRGEISHVNTKSSASTNKSAHNAIERRYRNNINACFSELKDAVPALRYAKVKQTTASSGKRAHSECEDEEDVDGETYLDGVAVATKLNKATILRKATEYILSLRHKGEMICQENAMLENLVSQLPGGPQVLFNYRAQQNQRQQDMKCQLAEQRQLEKQRAQKQRKRARNRHSSPSDDSSSSSSVSGPSTPDMASRTFMAAFFLLSLFSSTPMTHPATLSEPHQQRTTESIHPHMMSMGRNESESTLLGSLFPLDSGWSIIRTTIIVLCILQLVLPMVRHQRWPLRVTRVRKATRPRPLPTRTKPVKKSLGDQKCLHIYKLLVDTLEKEQDRPPTTHIGLILGLAIECSRLAARHLLGYDFSFGPARTPQEEWSKTCKWIKLNEIECLGGNPNGTTLSMLYSCTRAINLTESLDEQEHQDVEQSRARVYATAAMQLTLLPHLTGLARYFWRLAMYEAIVEGGCGEESVWMRSLMYDVHQDNAVDSMDAMLESRAWHETLQVMRHQMDTSQSGLCLSLNAPVLVPVAILSTLHLLDNLRTQFGRLIISITAVPVTSADASESGSDFNETAFDTILYQNDLDELDPGTDLAQWLAAVGAIVEALWKSDIKTAEKWMALVPHTPRSLVAVDNELSFKSQMDRLDELLKNKMVLILSGATLLKLPQPQRSQGIALLEKAEATQADMKKILIHRRREDVCGRGLESAVMACAEFVVGLTGLEAWITAWGLAPPDEVCALGEQVVRSTSTLRRMMRCESLDGLKTNQALLERLSRLCAFVSQALGEDDFSYQTEDGTEMCHPNLDNDGSLQSLRADKALNILRGLD